MQCGNNVRMNYHIVKNNKTLSSKADWQIWKQKIRDQLDYHQGVLDVIDGTLVKPEVLATGVDDNAEKNTNRKTTVFVRQIVSPSLLSRVQYLIRFIRKLWTKQQIMKCRKRLKQSLKLHLKINYLNYAIIFSLLFGSRARTYQHTQPNSDVCRII